MNTIEQKITKNKFPLLRFLEFTDNWRSISIQEIINRVSKPVDVETTTLYQQIGIRSHGKGIFYKEPVTGKSLGNKRVFWIQPNMFIVNIVFAWEHAVARTTEKELGMIASHRFPMYEPIKNKVDLDFLMYFFLRKRGKYLLGLASPGGAGRNKTLGQQTFAKLKVNIPSLPEQQKIANFLSSVDKKIEQLRQKVSLLEGYKKGVMQQIFSQQIRFKDDNGEAFADWHNEKLEHFLSEPKKRNYDLKYDKNGVLSVSGKYGIVNQIEFQGRSFAGVSVANYHVVEEGDIVYTKSPLKANPYGIIKVNKGKAGIVSTLYAVYSCKENVSGTFIDYYFQLGDNLNRYLRPLVRKGAKNDMKINNSYVLSDYVHFPTLPEQEKIVSYLESLDELIQRTEKQLKHAQVFKKGLLQQMFV